MAQKPDESVEQFITRLKQRAETCEFGDANAVNEQIRDQVIEKCAEHNLRRKLLEKGKGLTLAQLQDIARAMEYSEKQARHIEGGHEGAQVNKVSYGGPKMTVHKPRTDQKRYHYQKPRYQKKGVTCFKCGRDGHKADSESCPARGKKCLKCGDMDHFAVRCKTKAKARVHQVHDFEDEDHFAFSVTGSSSGSSSNIDIIVGGVQIEAVIDSGASCNVMSRRTWEYLKKQSVDCISKKSTKKIFAYGSSKPIPVTGTFLARVACGSRFEKRVEFLVIEGQGQTLLGKETSIKLGVLRVGPVPRSADVNEVRSSQDTVSQASGDGLKSELIRKYPKGFSGLGTLKNFELDIAIDPEVKPVAQPLRRVPYNLRERLEKKLQELESMDIIEHADGPTSWVSPVVVVPKGDNDIRLCVDMRQANTAVLRERHPIPTIDEVLQDLNNSKVFSKIDIKWAYHQIMLSEKSRDITTFVTHKGLFRYKRLMFGVSCAPELYQKVMQQVLQECEGVQNIMDDVIVHGASQKEHDDRLRNVVRVLCESGMTLNSEKCEFNMSKLVFMGHVLSEKGIGPSEVKVKAVLEAREPVTATEVRSFLGLVNYSARFIPNLATLSAPLRK